MSTYANIFMRVNDIFIPIADYSRNSALGRHLCRIMPYEKIKVLNIEDISSLMDEIQKEESLLKNSILKCKEERDELLSFCKDMSEKLEVIERYRAILCDIEEELEEHRHAYSNLCFIYNMFAEIQYGIVPKGIDINNYLYCGVEIGYPKVEDIVE